MRTINLNAWISCCSAHFGSEISDKTVYIWSGHVTDVGLLSPGPVEEPAEDKQSRPETESQEQEEDEDTDTDDGAVGEDENKDGS